MRVTTAVGVTIAAPCEAVFDLATDPRRIPELFVGWGPIPGIVEVTVHGAGRQRAGARRTVRNTDGTCLEEVLLAFERPHLQSYRLEGPFKGVSRLLLDHATGHWTFTSRAVGPRPQTEVRWEFGFELRSPIAVVVALPLAKLAFRRAQRRCLANLARACAALCAAERAP